MSEEEVNKIIEVYDEVIADLKKENQQLQEMHKTMARYALENEAKIDKLKSTLEEIREYIENHYEDRSFDEIHNEILQIIDKGVNND